MGRNEYSDEVKAAALAALASGESAAVVAVRLALPVGTVRGWKYRLLTGGSTGAVSAGVRDRIGELVLQYLSESLRALREQAKVFGDPEWIGRQPAGDIAILHGVMCDKSIRILEALEGPEPDDGAAGGAGAL